MNKQNEKYNYPFAAVLLLLVKIEGRISQKEIVEDSGLSQSKVSRIMNGLSIGTVKDRKQIAKSISKRLKEFEGWELDAFENKGKELIRNQETKKLISSAASTPISKTLFNNQDSLPSFPKYESGFAGELLKVFKEFSRQDIAIDMIKNLVELEKVNHVEFFRIYILINDALKAQRDSLQSFSQKTGTVE